MLFQRRYLKRYRIIGSETYHKPYYTLETVVGSRQSLTAHFKTDEEMIDAVCHLILALINAEMLVAGRELK